MARSRRWCFTLNNPTEDEVLSVRSLVGRGLARYVCFGWERAPETGTPHLQGYLEVGVSQRRTAVSGVLLGRAHVESARGTAQDNKRYCEKEGQLEEYGQYVTQGQRTELARAAAIVQEFGLKRAAEDEPTVCIKYHKGLQWLRNKSIPAWDETKERLVEVHWGRAGAGKTRQCLAAGRSRGRVWMHTFGPWFDNYDGEEVAILDDMPADVPFRLLLKCLDRYPLQVPVKGGFVEWVPEAIYLTSNLNINEWYPTIGPEELQALRRRVTRFVHYE